MAKGVVAASNSIVELATRLDHRLRQFRRRLHMHPELSWEERETTAQIRSFLEREGIRILPLRLKTGLCAEVGDASGPLVLVRADIDALPISEENDVPYRSQHSGVMHACGHDFHTAVLIGVAKVLQQLRVDNGRIRFVFQPAEESGDGASAVIRAGALDPTPGMIFGFHAIPDRMPGTFALRPGPTMAACDIFDIRLRGKGGHAANPDQSIDANVAAAHVILGLQSIVSRELPPGETAVVTVGRIRGGESRWTIPPEICLEGTARTFTPAARKRVEEAVHRIAEQVGGAYRTEAEVIYEAIAPPVVNHPQATNVVNDAITAILGLDRVDVPPLMTISDDFAFYSQEAPSCYFFTGIGFSDRREACDLHHPRFDVNETAIVPTVAVLTKAALDGLEQLRSTQS